MATFNNFTEQQSNRRLTLGGFFSRADVNTVPQLAAEEDNKEEKNTTVREVLGEGWDGRDGGRPDIKEVFVQASSRS